MKAVLSYSLFGDPSSFEFGYYLRGCLFNARMNHILYPEITIHLHISGGIYETHKEFFIDLSKLTDILITSFLNGPRCENMLRRLEPLFWRNATHVICRDLDSVSTYREALCTYEWLKSRLPYHAINDNAAHGGLMGGLVSFKSEDFKCDTGYASFEQMIKGQNLSKHGSDQDFMNKNILPKIKNKLFLHNLKGAGCEASVVKTEVPASGPIDKKLWLSDLISRYIGSAGVIDMELIRFLRSVDPNPKFDEFESKYSDICYWAKYL